MGPTVGRGRLRWGGRLGSGSSQEVGGPQRLEEGILTVLPRERIRHQLHQRLRLRLRRSPRRPTTHSASVIGCRRRAESRAVNYLTSALMLSSVVEAVINTRTHHPPLLVQRQRLLHSVAALL